LGPSTLDGAAVEVSDGAVAQRGDIVSGVDDRGAGADPVEDSRGELRRAQREADVRSDLTAVELLTMISSLPKPAPGARRNQYLEVVLRALRT
jgi:hypothetical protein